MTTPEQTALTQLALDRLAEYAGPAPSAEAVAAATDRAYDDLAGALAPVIGDVGVNALVDRALHLVQRDYTWLTDARGQSEGLFAPVTHRLKQQEPAVAAQAAGALFATFISLLVTFIGEPLTARLLRQAWPGAVPGAGFEET